MFSVVVQLSLCEQTDGAVKMDQRSIRGVEPRRTMTFNVLLKDTRTDMDSRGIKPATLVCEGTCLFNHQDIIHHQVWH